MPAFADGELPENGAPKIVYVFLAPPPQPPIAAPSLKTVAEPSLKAAADQSQKNYYFKVKVGILQPTLLGGNTGLNNAPTTYTMGLALGRKIDDLVSVDVEYMYRGKSTAEFNPPGSATIPSSWSVNSNTLMLNGSVNLMKDSNIVPYFRAGIGISINKGGTYTKTTDSAIFYYPGETTNNAAWQIGAGMTFYTNDLFSSELEYMFVNRGSVKTKAYSYASSDHEIANQPARKGDLRDHVITLGFKFKF